MPRHSLPHTRSRWADLGRFTAATLSAAIPAAFVLVLLMAQLGAFS